MCNLFQFCVIIFDLILNVHLSACEVKLLQIDEEEEEDVKVDSCEYCQ